MVGLNLSKIKLTPDVDKESGSSSSRDTTMNESASPSVSTNPSESKTMPESGKPMGLAAMMAAKARGETLNLPTPASKELVVAEAIPSEKIESVGPAGFAEKLQTLDKAIGDIDRISKLEIDTVRGFIVDIMTDLRKYPEYVGMVRAKDTHNLMKYIQDSYAEAQNTFALSAEKREKEDTKKFKKNQIVLPADFGAAFGAGDTPVKKVNTTFDLSAFAGMDTSDIESKK